MVKVRLDGHWPDLPTGTVQCDSVLQWGSALWRSAANEVVVFDLTSHSSLIPLIGLSCSWALCLLVVFFVLVVSESWMYGWCQLFIIIFFCVFLRSTAGCKRVHTQTARLAGRRLPDEGWRRQVTTVRLTGSVVLRVFLFQASEFENQLPATGKRLLPSRRKDLLQCYKYISCAFREGEKPKNPMVELFYGRFLAVGVLEGELWCSGKPRKTNKK